MSLPRAQARVDLAAIERNCMRLRGELKGETQLCAVVKANGYGHGVLPCARAALKGGASWLAVASLEEAREVRQALDTRLLIMGPLCADELEQALGLNVEVVLWRERHVQRAQQLAAAAGVRARVHIKLDSGMGRLGCKDPQEASRAAAAAIAASDVDLAGVMTHFATADEPAGEFFKEQLERFSSWAQPIKRSHPQLVVHAANSAATLRCPRAHFDMVRCGIAIYGLDPFGEDPLERRLEPALELSSRVAEVKRYQPGESAGYGRRFFAERETHLAVLPIGYGDGWRRGLSNNAQVLIGGRSYPLVGTISMDSLTVDLGPAADAVSMCGSEAVLIGKQGTQRITAEQVARALDTINYEVTCGLTPRVTRVYDRHDGVEGVDAP
ncbi:MAG TPA: alanine racemase [Solirubrobacteraceae bacterium]